MVAFDTIVDADFDQRHGIKRMSLDDLLACSDVVSLHVPLNDATRGMVNREFLAKMKPGSYLINTARGGLVVERDLRDAVLSGHLAGAGLDVMSKEPPDPDNPLLGVPNIILCPHIAGTDLQIDERHGRPGSVYDRRALTQPLAGGMCCQFGVGARVEVVIARR